MNTQILTQAHLKEILHYNPDNGQFTWRVKPAQCVALGAIAGGISSNDGYVRIGIKGKDYPAHRLAFLYMTGALPAEQTDHINHKRADNRWCNLRAVTHKENMRNQKQYSTNTSGVTGVHWNKRLRKWHVQINIHGKRFHGGLFISKQEAISRRRELEKEHSYNANHGD